MNRPRPLRSTKAPRAWQRMLSGRRLDLLDPSPLDIEIEDIAHGLARVARWNGQTTGAFAFSVAQHSLVVEDLVGHLKPGVDADLQLAALLHDGAEYVIGDMISPFKAVLGGDYKAVEDRLGRAVHLRFGLPAAMPAPWKKLIKRADLICAWMEATQLAGFTDEEADSFFIRPEPSQLMDLTPQAPEAAQTAFLDRFAEILDQFDQAKPGT